MIQYKIFKIKKGKKEKWLQWCKEIMERYNEAAETLQEENVIHEKCTIVGDFIFYKHEIIEGADKIPMNMAREINKKHAEMMNECIEPARQINGYDIKIKGHENL